MRALLISRLVALATLLFLTFAVTQGDTTATVAAIAAVLVAAAITAALVIGTRARTVGNRAHAHREPLDEVPAPAHPDTAGRPRSRAPSLVVPAA